MVVLRYGLWQDQFLKGCLVISVVVTKMVAMSLAMGPRYSKCSSPSSKELFGPKCHSTETKNLQEVREG